jgi:enoyl-CoA hydratase/carnithine racemase
MIVLRPDDVAATDRIGFDALLARREAILAIGAGDLRGLASAAVLHSDFCTLCEGATLAFDSPEAWSGAAWRIGRGAVRLLLNGARPIAARDAMTAGLADGIVPPGTDPLQWIERWIGGRSELAIDSAASLIRRRGGDSLERAEFARIFAAGEPQEGLAAFLEKRKPQWRNRV